MIQRLTAKSTIEVVAGTPATGAPVATMKASLKAVRIGQ
jgi:hypothetical protein